MFSGIQDDKCAHSSGLAHQARRAVCPVPPGYLAHSRTNTQAPSQPLPLEDYHSVSLVDSKDVCLTEIYIDILVD